MWFKHDRDFLKRLWPTKPPAIRQQLVWLAMLAWEEQGIVKDFDYLAWLSGISADKLAIIWPDYEAASCERESRWMPAEMWQAFDAYQAKVKQASNAGKTGAKRRPNDRPAPVEHPLNDRLTPVEHPLDGRPTDKNKNKNKNINPPLPPLGGGSAREPAPEDFMPSDKIEFPPGNPADRLPNELDEFERAVKEVTCEGSSHWGVTQRVREKTTELRGHGFTLADLRAFDAQCSKTSQLNFIVRDMLAWRRDKTRAPNPNIRLTQAEINRGGIGKLVL